MPLQATSGAASYDAFGGGVAAVPQYIEDVFSTFVYAGNSTNRSIVNDIDLSGKGGLVWIKDRNAGLNHTLFDTARGATNYLFSDSTNAQDTAGNTLTAFNSNGFNLGTNSSYVNGSGYNYASWTFRKAPKFFDVVTYSGSNSTQTISHNLGSTPGCIIIKKLDSNLFNAGWAVYHRSLTNPNNYYLTLNSTDAETNYGGAFISSVNSTTFTVAGGAGQISIAGSTYVAYLFAHNAGGFGLTGTDNVISCGSYTGNGSTTGPIINLGYEPQWVMVKAASTTSDWFMADTMRGQGVSSSSSQELKANTSGSEQFSNFIAINSTGFQLTASVTDKNGSGQTFIYIAIRRGPMKVPTSGTSVYNAVSRTGTGTAATITGIGFAPDLLDNQRTTAGSYTGFFDRLRGAGKLLYRALADAETTVANQTTQFNTTMDGFAVGSSTASDSGNNNTVPYIWHCFKRAPSFFDQVCWTRSTTTATLNHNLGVVPELIIKKDRSRAGTYWDVMPNVSPYDYRYDIYLNDTQAISGPSSIYWNAAPTATTFDVHMGFDGSSNGDTFVAYLFATCAGVSKVGSYTGTGALQTVNCGFAAGARFILIKRTDSTGDWYVYDSTRGITSGNDPYLLWNTTGAEVTNTNYVDTTAVGFQVTAAAPAGLNASGGTYIFLAIA